MLLVSKKVFTSRGTLNGLAWRPFAVAFRGRSPGGSWAWSRGSVLTGLFLCSGSHRQFKRPERSFTLEAEEPTGSLSPLTPGESDQCPRQGPCRLQPGYDQPGLFQGEKLVGGIMWTNQQMGKTPSPHPVPPTPPRPNGERRQARL
jgi:hypothetical protein